MKCGTRSGKVLRNDHDISVNILATAGVLSLTTRISKLVNLGL